MKGNIITCALIAFFLLLTLQPGKGPLLILLLPVFLTLVICHSVHMIRRSDELKSRGIRIAAWSAAVVLAGGVQLYWSGANRAEADSAVRKILEYRQRTGSYPASLIEARLDEFSTTRKFKYRVRNGKPALAYPAAFMPFSMYEYDFEAGVWRQNAY